MIAASFRCCRGGRYKINRAEAIGPGAWQRNVCVRTARAAEEDVGSEPARPREPSRCRVAADDVGDDHRAEESAQLLEEVPGDGTAGEQSGHRRDPLRSCCNAQYDSSRRPIVEIFCIWYTRYAASARLKSAPAKRRSRRATQKPPSLRAKRSNPTCRGQMLDCFVAPLLAMTAP